MEIKGCRAASAAAKPVQGTFPLCSHKKIEIQRSYSNHPSTDLTRGPLLSPQMDFLDAQARKGLAGQGRGRFVDPVPR